MTSRGQGLSAETTPVQGTTAPGFESVLELVAGLGRPWGRGGGSIAAYVDGELVIDLWGGQARPGSPWQQDTLTTVASVTKSWAALVVAKLVEQGVLDYDELVCTYWPEFTSHGKDGVRLRDLFTHSSGVLSFDNQVEILDAGDCAGWKDLDAIAAGLAAAKPAWTPGSRNGYHAVSYGWLLNEVVRRASGRTIGDLFHTDFAVPLGLDSHLGTDAKEHDRVAEVLVADTASLPGLQRKVLAGITTRSARPESLAGRAFLSDGSTTILDRVATYAANASFLEAEIPASNGTSTARSLARLFACLAAGGELDGVRVLSPETIRTMAQTRGIVRDSVMREALPWFARSLLKPAPTSHGLIPNTKQKGRYVAGPHPEAFWTAGFGGQLVTGDPVSGLSFASVFSDFTPGLDKALQQPVLDELYRLLPSAKGTPA
ncbi:MAG: esterase [Frankiales bacterium]|nr:esterase [Frankiales bacterium]